MQLKKIKSCPFFWPQPNACIVAVLSRCHSSWHFSFLYFKNLLEKKMLLLIFSSFCFALFGFSPLIWHDLCKGRFINHGKRSAPQITLLNIRKCVSLLRFILHITVSKHKCWETLQRTFIGTETVAHGDEKFIINAASQSCDTKKKWTSN